MPYDAEAVKELMRRAEESVKRANGHAPKPEPPPQEVNKNPLPVAYHDWRYKVGMVVKKTLDDVPVKDRPMIASMQPERLIDLIVKQAHEVVDSREAPWWPLTEGLSESEVEEELHALAGKAIAVFRDAYLPATVGEPETYVIPFEDYTQALAANEAYLKRLPVVAGLYYASALSMITGGKHAGKSTLARWLAICVAKGYRFLEREVQKGLVLYLASEDEAMAARTELERLGWVQGDPLQFMSMASVEVDQINFLDALSEYVRKNEAKLVVMDMLFDFARIGDEMSYAQTREALGTIQKVATAGNCHIVVIHHSPKYATVNDAAVTALGSQGLAARVSPIVQVRRHGPNVHSVVSTAIRDPRGEPIDERRLTLSPDGSLVLGKPWKDWMQAEVFESRVYELFEAEPGQEMTRADVQEELDISYQLAGACLKQLHDKGMLTRTGTGRRGNPFRYATPPEIRPANQNEPEKNRSQGKDHDQSEINFKPPSEEGSQHKNRLTTPPGDDED